MSNLVMGVDECGCAALAGSVTAAAVIVEKKQKKIAGVNDSKQLNKSRRETLFPEIKDRVIAYAVGSADISEIKKLNIYWSKLLAMKRAVDQIVEQGFTPNKILVDGNKTIPDIDYDQEAIIKGDQKIWWIGAASIIGKVTRDSLMADLAKEKQYSHYDWENNAGYFTIPHMKGIIKNGFSDLHRKEFVYSKFCISLHKEFSNSDLASVDDWLESAYGDKIDLDDDWALYKYWKIKKEMKLKQLGWD